MLGLASRQNCTFILKVRVMMSIHYFIFKTSVEIIVNLTYIVAMSACQILKYLNNISTTSLACLVLKHSVTINLELLHLMTSK